MTALIKLLHLIFNEHSKQITIIRYDDFSKSKCSFVDICSLT